MGAEAYKDYRAAIHDTATVHGMVEDYRAGLGIDGAHDDADRGEGRRIACPTIVLWSLCDDFELLYGDVLAVWKPWTTRQRGRGLDCGHHMAEEVPYELANEILASHAKTNSSPQLWHPGGQPDGRPNFENVEPYHRDEP